MRVLVLTIDQQSSRIGPDLVPDTVAALDDIPLMLGFERTAGDEFQGVLDDPASLPRVLELLLRDQAWNVGVGLGELESPLPDSARAGRGTAYLTAREAVTAAKRAPWHTRVVGGERDTEIARALETTIWLWASVLERRTARGWEVADLVDTGLSYDEVGHALGITQSAVSQRAQAAGIVESRRARELTAWLAGSALEGGTA